MRYIARAFCLLVLPATLLQAQAAAPKPVTIGVADTMWSATLKESRRFLVYTPPSYNDTTYQPRSYPVLYLLDGDAVVLVASNIGRTREPGWLRSNSWPMACMRWVLPRPGPP